MHLELTESTEKCDFFIKEIESVLYSNIWITKERNAFTKCLSLRHSPVDDLYC